MLIRGEGFKAFCVKALFGLIILALVLGLFYLGFVVWVMFQID